MSERLEFKVGQIPKRGLAFTVNDENGLNVLPLGDYAGAQVLVYGPDGVLRATLTASITDSDNGKVESAWPVTSPFDVTGDYLIQLELTNGAASDYATSHRAVVRELGV